MQVVCGICGILDAGTRVEERERRVAAMANASIHRGPDDAGSWSAGPVSLGFRRLGRHRSRDRESTAEARGRPRGRRLERRDLQLPRAARRADRQGPPVSHEGRRRGLPATLRRGRNGGLRASPRDVRVRPLGRQRGSTLLLGRDRFGIKPLFVARRGEQIAFASELSSAARGRLPGLARHRPSGASPLPLAEVHEPARHDPLGREAGPARARARDRTPR